LQIDVLNDPDLTTGNAIAEERKHALSAQEDTSWLNVYHPKWNSNVLTA